MATLDERPNECAVCGGELQDFQICPRCMLLYIVWGDGTTVGANIEDYASESEVPPYMEN